MQDSLFTRAIRTPEAPCRMRGLEAGDVPGSVARASARGAPESVPRLRATRDRPTVAPPGVPNPTLRRCWVDVMQACGILGKMPHAFDLMTRLTSNCPGHDVEAMEGADRVTAVRTLHRVARRLTAEQEHTLRELGQHVLARCDGDADQKDRDAMEAADTHRVVAKFCAVLLALRPLSEPPLAAQVALPAVDDFLAALASSRDLRVWPSPVRGTVDTPAHDAGTPSPKRKRDPSLQAQGEADARARKRRKALAEPSMRIPVKLRADAAPVYADIATAWDEMEERIAQFHLPGRTASGDAGASAPAARSITAEGADPLQARYKPSVLCQRWKEYASAGFPERHDGAVALVQLILQGMRDEFHYFSGGFNDEVCRVVADLKAHDQVSDLMDLVDDWRSAPRAFPGGSEAAPMASLAKWLVQALFR